MQQQKPTEREAQNQFPDVIPNSVHGGAVL
jgi:hypothetical protein